MLGCTGVYFYSLCFVLGCIGLDESVLGWIRSCLFRLGQFGAILCRFGFDEMVSGWAGLFYHRFGVFSAQLLCVGLGWDVD